MPQAGECVCHRAWAGPDITNGFILLLHVPLPVKFKYVKKMLTFLTSLYYVNLCNK